MSSQPWQLGMSATGELVAIIRYSVDQCSCGHPWSDHYQPTRGGKASCWATRRGVRDAAARKGGLTTQYATPFPYGGGVA